MAKENSFSITKITMTPKTALTFCIVGAVVLTLVLAIGAVCWTQEGGSMFGNRTGGGGGGGGGSVSDAADDTAYDILDDAEVIDDSAEDPAEGSDDDPMHIGSAYGQPVALLSYVLGQR